MNRAFIIGSLICISCAMAAAPQPRELARGRQPQAAVDARGTVWLVYADGDNAIWLARSGDGGKTFAQPAKVAQLDHKLALGMRRG